MKRSWKVLGMAALCSAACNSSTTVGSQFIKTQLIQAAQGGTLAVTSSDNQTFAGTALQVPPKALAQDTTLTVAQGAALTASQLGGATAVGPVVDLGPSTAAFSLPATVTLPFPPGASGPLSVVGIRQDGTVLTVGPADLALDATHGLLSFKALGLGRFECVGGQPQPCPAGEALCGCNGSGLCIPQGIACPAFCPADGGVGIPADAGQICCPAGDYLCGCGEGSGTCVPDDQTCIVNCPAETSTTAPPSVCCPVGDYFCGCNGQGECVPNDQACPLACAIDAGVPPPPDACCPTGDYFCGCANGAGSCFPNGQNCILNCPAEPVGITAPVCCPPGEAFCGCEGVGECIPSGQACPALCGAPDAGPPVQKCTCECAENDPNCICDCDGGTPALDAGCPGTVCCNGTCALPGQACPDICPADAGPVPGCACECAAGDPNCVCDCDGGAPAQDAGCPTGEMFCGCAGVGECLPEGQACPTFCAAPDAGPGCACACPAGDANCICNCDGGTPAVDAGCPGTVCCDGECVLPGQFCPDICFLDAGPGPGCACSCPANDPSCVCDCDGGSAALDAGCPGTVCCDGECALPGQLCPPDCPADAG